METNVLGLIAAITIPLAYALGIASALDAVMKGRTAQGATAWALGSIAMPFIAVPLYWFFGRARFSEYVKVLRDFDSRVEAQLEAARDGVLEDWVVRPEEEPDVRTRGELKGFRNLATLPFTRGNETRLLIDGEATFEAIFAAIDAARDYVLVQFYILRDDEIGTALKERLLDAAGRGVRVYLLYDEVGCQSLSRSYCEELSRAGAEVSGFGGRRSWLGRFRLNFRNHRKIVIVDGRKGFVGGLNVGDEYLGRDPKLSPWRDTHLAVAGPVVQGLQHAFVRDWYYGRQQTPELTWSIAAAGDDRRALVLASAPSDRLETCGLLYTHAIESAERRLWIASPYFVPDDRVLGALQLAALRGVDVRIMMPRQTDNRLFNYVPYAYLPQAEQAGVKVFLYEEGFMHQKVMVVDDDYAAVGTANFDNRSFRLNFEVTCLVNSAEFCAEVEAMLERDFARSTQLTEESLADRSYRFRFATQVTRLLAPVL